jgi:hypothetical protein
MNVNGLRFIHPESFRGLRPPKRTNSTLGERGYNFEIDALPVLLMI